MSRNTLELHVAKLLRGTGVSSGIGRGTAYVLASSHRAAGPRLEIEPSAIDAELSRFEVASSRALTELTMLIKVVSEKIGESEAGIFEAQALLLGDAGFRKRVTELVRRERINVEAALAQVIEKFTVAFDQISDPYLRERAVDIRDVGRRVLTALIEEHGSEGLEIPDGAVLVTDELLPSAVARLELRGVRAIVTERGGKFSHTSILARSLGIPAVAGVADAVRGIKTGDRLIVDGIAGFVFRNPIPSVEGEYQRLETEMRADKDKLRELVDLPSVRECKVFRVRRQSDQT